MLTPDLDLDPKNPPYVPGELIITLTAAVNGEVMPLIPDTLSPLSNDSIPTRFGLEEIDKALEPSHPVSINRVHGLMPDSRVNKNNGSRELAASLAATYRIKLSEGAEVKTIATELERLPQVEAAYPNYLSFAMAVTPNDTFYASQWGLNSIHCPEAWTRTKGSSSVVVAVVDSGVDLNHPDLNDNLVQGRDFVNLPNTTNVGDIITISGQQWRIEGDIRTVDTVPQDEVGHGTHVAGIIGAESNNTQGVTGVAWNCRLMPMRVMYRLVRLSDGFVTGSGTNANISAGIRWAADNGADVINLSLGGFFNDPGLNTAVQYAITQGCVVVAAMGNHGSGTPAYPAAFANVLSVGAVDSAENRAWFSATGPHIDVCAPGVSIRSTDWDDTYSDKSGTSMATPYVAGLAALILSCNGSLTPTQVVQIIRDTAKPLRDNPGDPVPNNNYGTGLINAKAALDRACPPVVIKRPWIDDIVINTTAWWDNHDWRIVTSPIRDIGFDRDKWRIPGTTPRNGDVKNSFSDKARGLDKAPIGDRIPDRGDLPSGASPFVLATPHHYTDREPGNEVKQRYQQVFAEAARRLASGDLSQQEISEIDALYEEYKKL